MEEIPDVLGQEGRAAVVRAMFEVVQRQLYSLDVEQTANGADGEDPLPNTPLGPNGEVTNYNSRRKDLIEAQARLVEEYADVLPMIVEASG